MDVLYEFVGVCTHQALLASRATAASAQCALVVRVGVFPMVCVLVAVVLMASFIVADSKPNIVLLLTDDQDMVLGGTTPIQFTSDMIT